MAPFVVSRKMSSNGYKYLLEGYKQGYGFWINFEVGKMKNVINKFSISYTKDAIEDSCSNNSIFNQCRGNVQYWAFCKGI